MKTVKWNLLLTAYCCCTLLCGGGHALSAQATPSFFVSSGLLAKADERAEDILLRAHGLERDALILTIIGYYNGIGGFPKSPYLAAEWHAQHLIKTNDLEAISLLTLMLRDYINEADKDVAGEFALCPRALKSPLVPLLKQEGLFDAEQVCDGLKQEKPSVPDWNARYDEVSDTLSMLDRELSGVIRAIRAFRDEPCSKERTKGLQTALQKGIPDTETFYAATTHNPATQAPDWNAERLLSYLDKRIHCPRQAASESDVENGSSRLDALSADMAAADMAAHLLADRNALLSTIRSAHNFSAADSRKAIRAMAAQYRAGSPGFPLSDTLADLWLQHAAFSFDDESALSLAVKRFSEKRYAEAWAWADGTAKSKHAAETTKELAARLVAVIEDRAGQDVRTMGSRHASAYAKAMADLVKWYEEQP